MIFHSYVSLPDGIWWFPFRHRGTPKSSSIFVDGIFRSKTNHFWDPPWLWKPPWVGNYHHSKEWTRMAYLGRHAQSTHPLPWNLGSAKHLFQDYQLPSGSLKVCHGHHLYIFIPCSKPTKSYWLIYSKWRCSIAILVYQRVDDNLIRISSIYRVDFREADDRREFPNSGDVFRVWLTVLRGTSVFFCQNLQKVRSDCDVCRASSFKRLKYPSEMHVWMEKSSIGGEFSIAMFESRRNHPLYLKQTKLSKLNFLWVHWPAILPNFFKAYSTKGHKVLQKFQVAWDFRCKSTVELYDFAVSQKAK